MNFLATRFAIWLITLALFPLPVRLIPYSFHLEVLCGVTSPPNRPGAEVVSAEMEEGLAALDFPRRVVARLVEAEGKEPNAHFRDDYRVSRVTVGFARSGSPIPDIEASYEVLGLHPDQVWPSIVARRKAQLGAEYALYYDEHGNRRPANLDFAGVSSPKKPAGSVSLREFHRRRRNKVA